MLLLATFAFTLCACKVLPKQAPAAQAAPGAHCKNLPKEAAEAQAAPGAQAKPSTVPHVDETSYYTVLGIQKTASESEIKKAYRKLSRKVHPDRCPDKDDEKLKKVYEEVFKKVCEAYETLSDPAKRAEYDQSITPQAKAQKAKQDRQDQQWRDDATRKYQQDLARAREQQQRRHDDAQRQYAEDQRNYWNAQAEAQRQEAERQRKAAEQARVDAERRQQVEQDRIYAQDSTPSLIQKLQRRPRPFAVVRKPIAASKHSTRGADSSRPRSASSENAWSSTAAGTKGAENSRTANEHPNARLPRSTPGTLLPFTA